MLATGVLWLATFLRMLRKLTVNRGEVLAVTFAMPFSMMFFGSYIGGAPVEAVCALYVLAMALVWLASGFRPELMVDHDEPGVDEALVERSEKAQLRLVVLIVLVSIALGVVFWDEIPVD
ncbi:hypothetical protein LV78_004498 [Actinosynnema pretiosum]|nr:hypothetical protein [Actinosynnema pretiosum]